MRTIPLALAAVALLACTPDDSQRPVTTAAALPANAPRVESFVPPKPGTKLVYRSTSDKGNVSTTTFIVEERSYENRPVLAAATLDKSTVRLYERETGHWFASLDKDGKEVWRTAPALARSKWPLIVGDRWQASWAYYDRKAGTSQSPIMESWVVEGVEEVTVPAGTFTAFRLQSTPMRNLVFQLTHWYAPSVGANVKEITIRTREHSQGYGRFVAELVEYEPAKP